VLGALSLLLLALMVALSFNLSHALRAKTRLQQHSDALAYSMAIIEARTLNYFAVSNRAIAATYVAMNSAHGYLAAASVTSQMMQAAKTNFHIIAGMEALWCSGCAFGGSGCSHCPHIFQALNIARKFGREAQSYEGKIQPLEPPFNQVVTQLDQLMDSIHASQMMIFLATQTALRDGSSYGLSQLKAINAPRSNDLPPAVGLLNAAEFGCAIDGMPCPLPGKPGNSSLASRAHVMTEVANATRPNWAANRGLSEQPFPLYLHPKFMTDLMSRIQGQGATFPVEHDGTSKTVQQRGSSALHQGSVSNNPGRMSSAHEHGTLFSWWKHGLGFSNYSAEVVSDANGGTHQPRRAHTTQHRFEGTNTRDLLLCAGRGNCFMKFRADPDPRRDFGQPHVYSYISERLRLDDVSAAPWQLNDTATLKFQNGKKSQATVQLAANEGAGLSQALVYYHRLTDWREPPNMFNPFWRAKLHPLAPRDAVLVLEAAGNQDAAQLAAAPRLPL
jgi:hypothetical protein